MKKIFSLVLAFILTLTAFQSITIAEQSSDYTAESKYAAVLAGIGAISYEPEAGDMARNVTKAELVGAVVDMMGKTATVNKNNKYFFADVNADTLNADKIQFAKESGLIGSTSLFHPELNAETDDAVTMLLNVLGYNKYSAASSDTWVTASKIGLFDGVSISQGSALTWAQLVVMLYNAIDIEILQPTAITDNGTIYATKDGETVLTEYFDIFKFEGIVSATKQSSLGSDEGLGDDCVQVGSLVMNTGTSGIENLLGYNVEGYANLVGSKYTVLYAEEFDNKIWELDDSVLVTDSSDWSQYSIVYEEKGVEKKLRLSPEVDVIYNGKCSFDYTADTLKINSGNIVAIDNNSGGGIDVVIINELDNYIVNTYDSVENILYDKTGRKLDLGDSSATINIVNGLGEPYDLSLLTENTIVSLYVSLDKTYIKGYVTKSKVIGTVTELKKAGENPETITFDTGVSYRVSNSWRKASFPGKDTIELGKKYIAYLDVNGEIAMIAERFSETLMYGFINGFVIPSGLDSVPKFRIFTQDGIWQEYTAAKKLNVNGTSYTASEIIDNPEVKAAVTSALRANQLVKFETNADDQIKVIYTGKSTTDVLPPNELAYHGEISAIWQSNGQTFDINSKTTPGIIKYAIDGVTAVFYTPFKIGSSTEYDYDNFDMLASSAFTSDKTYTADVYDIDEFLTAGALVVETKAGKDYWNAGAVLVKSLSRFLNAEGDEQYAVNGLRKGEEVTLTAIDDTFVKSLKSGDIFVAHYNSKGIIDQPLAFIYKAGTAFAPGGYSVDIAGSTSTSYSGEAYAMHGYAKAKNTSGLVFDCAGKLYYLPQSRITDITIYDAKAKDSDHVFTKASINEIVSSQDYDSASKLIVYFRSRIPLSVIIIK